MAEYSDLSVLIIDPNPGMRASLHGMLNQAGITRIEYAVSSGTAIRLLANNSFDVVLCEYDLGSTNNGQDGQQLLEDLRLHKLIGQWTIFIMLTSEGAYSKVIGAAELTPTDYILKPFTGDNLLGRITRAIDRRAVFMPVFQLVGIGNLSKAVVACQEAEQAHPRHAIEFARLRAELLYDLDELAAAAAVYQAILLQRPLGWVQLGLARCQFGLQQYEEAQQGLEALVIQNPKMMAAYDLLAKVHGAMGQSDMAKKILEDAVAISPNMVRRLRHLGEVAFETGDVSVAEKAFKQVVAKAKYSEFRDPEDHLNLVRTLVKKGDASQASGVIRDLERSMRGNNNMEACRAISSALLMEMTGDLNGAAAELSSAVAAVNTSNGLSVGLKIGLVHSCLKSKLDHQASELVLNLMNDTESGISTDDAVAVFEKAGRHDLALDVGVQVTRQVDELLADAAERRAQGDLHGAIDVLNIALRKTPGNIKLLLAAISAILKQLDDLGWESNLGGRCGQLIARAYAVDPGNAELEPLQQRYALTQRKYGIATTA